MSDADRTDVSRERLVLLALAEDGSSLKYTAIVIATAFVCVSTLLALGGTDATAIASAIGTAGTLLSLLVALIIFRWTLRQNDANSSQASKNHTELLGLIGSGVIRQNSFGDGIEDDASATNEASEEDDPELPTGLGTDLVLSGRDYVLTFDPSSIPASWWRQKLDRIRSVEANYPQYTSAAAELLAFPINQFLAVGSLKGSVRGNRRTLFVTRSPNDSHARVWSLFVGKGRHVIEVTEEVTFGR